MNLTWLRPPDATLEPIQGKLQLQRDDRKTNAKRSGKPLNPAPPDRRRAIILTASLQFVISGLMGGQHREDDREFQISRYEASLAALQNEVAVLRHALRVLTGAIQKYDVPANAPVIQQ